MNEELENMAIEKVAEILKGETFYYQDVECCVISDAEECYLKGYKDAIDKACEFINGKMHDDEDYGIWVQMKYKRVKDFINDLKKEMKVN